MGCKSRGKTATDLLKDWYKHSNLLVRVWKSRYRGSVENACEADLGKIVEIRQHDSNASFVQTLSFTEECVVPYGTLKILQDPSVVFHTWIGPLCLRAGWAINGSRGIVKRRHNRSLYAISEQTFLWRAHENLPEKVVFIFAGPLLFFQIAVWA